MILTAHQPAYLPWHGLLHKIAASDLFVVLDTVPFERNSYINRNRLPLANGPAWLTIPVATSGHLTTPIRDIAIADDSWQRKHWKTISQTYSKAPNWHRYQRELQAYYERPWTLLCDAATESLRLLLEWYGIKTPMRWASAYRVEGSKDEMLLNLCHATGADAFVFGAHGPSYADYNRFRAEGVRSFTQHYAGNGFSALHDLMFTDDAAKIMLAGGHVEG